MEFLFLLWFLLVNSVSCQEQNVLTPAYFNVAEGKVISANATCGVGVPTPGELYCKLTGNTGDVIRPGEQDIIQGQYCDFCDSNSPERAHPIHQAIDGTEKWWQSPPLSRGTEYNRVDVTLDLGQQYHIAYIIIKVANSPRPGMWVLERSRDYGETYEPWQYFAETDGDCFSAFNLRAGEEIINDDDVICSTEYSDIVPLEDGEIVFSLVNDRPGANNFSYSEVLQEWTKATNIRLRLLRPNTLLGHLMGIQQQDPTVTRRYYYSIKDISVGGRCVCNGHADLCDTEGDDGRLQCTCQHNTCGPECERCCPGYVQKRWRPATLQSSNECEACNCHNHTDECYFDEAVAQQRLSLDINGRYEGGGVCVNCQHNTYGHNCHECKPGYYRYPGEPLDSPTVCEPCNCDPFFSTGNCAALTGQCECKPQYTGEDCSECSDGYYGYPDCKPCDCNVNGTLAKVCLVESGRCPCKPNYAGRFCDRCEEGFYNFPSCTPCECNDEGSLDQFCNTTSGQCTCRTYFSGRVCDQCDAGYYNFPFCDTCSCFPGGVTDEVCDQVTGKCKCLDNFDGPNCDECQRAHYGYPICTACDCDETGSQSDRCDNRRGQCYCRRGFNGPKCDSCGAGYYRYPDCLSCNCNRFGSLSIRCDQQSGQCTCRNGYEGRSCDACAEGYYNFPRCEECNCNPAGVIETPGQPLGGCGRATQGACLCKENVIGRACDMCAPLHFDLQQSNPAGCQSCDCNTEGTLSGLAVCDMNSGQCLCKETVEGRQCTECKEGYYLLQGANAFGCQECGCDVGGSIHDICDKETGECICRPRVTGRTCNRPAEAHFYPSLHQIKIEAESGTTPAGYHPRIGYDEFTFPGFSHLAYVIFSSIQPAILIPVTVESSSIYRIVLHYVYNGEAPARGELSIIPSSPSIGSEQDSGIIFLPDKNPQFVTVEGATSFTSFVLNPGEWTIRIDAPEGVLLDYVVLVPSAFYEATILIQTVANPCVPGLSSDRCNFFTFPDLSQFPNIRGIDGYYYNEATDKFIKLEASDDEYLINELGVEDLAYLDNEKNNLNVAVQLNTSGEYYFIMEYYGGDADLRQGYFDVIGPDSTTTGFININSCSYLCRSVVLDADGQVMKFTTEEELTKLWFRQTDPPFSMAVSAIYAIPVEDFSYDFITPSLMCMRDINGDCLGSIFSQPPGSVVIDIADLSDFLPPNIHNPDTKLQYLSGKDGPRTITTDYPLPTSGRYVFVLHYYQPNGSSFDVDFNLLGGFNSEGTFTAHYCPHVSGCRSVVTKEDGSIVFDLSDLNQAIQVTVPDGAGSVWIDYILAIPENVYDSIILMENPQDRAADFIQYCSNDGLFVSMDSPDICQRAVFSISSEFNNGAISCDCNVAGSAGLKCEEIAGQCPCRPNIVGRKCDKCRIGYYDFPRCSPCECASGVCNETDGSCICPVNTIPGACDQCIPNTYGYDPLAGCVDCQCDSRGVADANSTCEPTTGQCRCLENIGGRRCDRCLPGFYQYPECLPCDCEPDGTEEQICDVVTSVCLCKANVVGVSCDQCATSTFSLDADNPDGCTECFCFGLSDDCRAYTRPTQELIDLDGWEVTNFKNSENRIRESDQERILYVNGQGDDPNQMIYWVAPARYMGNQLSSYGGYLEFTVYNSPRILRGDQGGEARLIRQPDILLSGNGINLMYSNLQQPKPNMDLTFRIKINEDNFQHESSRSKASREDLMMVLTDISSLQIRAQYFDEINYLGIKDISLDVMRGGNGAMSEKVANSVEICNCPPQYSGLSCERCAPGHYRIQAGMYLGYCYPCECNGHSDYCDVETGRCLACQDNTEGDHCEFCRRGFYGNATHGVCDVCPCPQPSEEQSFAESCEISATNQLVCDCIPGHTGRYCEQCMEGFFGDPSLPGGRCQRCQCNGNSNPDSPGHECDPIFGGCLSCQLETKGFNCEECADGYYGDAVYAKNCQKCVCNEYGTASCNNTNGLCTCRQNVVGSMCDRCKEFYYNLESGRGCQLCGCGIASTSFQCHESGICSCQPGVGGDKCDRCLEGFYDYTATGCTSCKCDENLRCDPDTGDCMCPIGAYGPNCEECEDGFIKTVDGCLPCDDCVLLLLSILEELDIDMTGLFNVTIGLGTLNKTQHINESIYEIEVATELNTMALPAEMQIGNFSIDLQNVKMDANETLNLALEVKDRSVGVLSQTNETLWRARNVFDKINATYGQAKGDKAADLRSYKIQPMKFKNAYTPCVSSDLKLCKSDVLVTPTLPTLPDFTESDVVRLSMIQTNDTRDISDLFEQAEKILQEIRQRDFSDFAGSANEETSEIAMEIGSEVQDEENLGIADKELKLAKDVLARVGALQAGSDDLFSRMENVGNQLDSLNEIIAELSNYTSISNTHSANVEEVATNNHSSNLQTLQMQISEMYSDSAIDLEKARKLLDDAELAKDIAMAEIYKSGYNASALQAATARLEARVMELNDSMDPSMRELVENATQHAQKLGERADYLASILVSTKDVAANALEAEAAYANIEAAIQEAEEAALIANNASNHAYQEAQTFSNKPEEFKKESNKKLKKAKKSQDNVEDLTGRLDLAEETVTNASTKLDGVNRDLEQIEAGMMAIPSADSACDIVVCATSCKAGFQGESCNVAKFGEQASRATQSAMDASRRLAAVTNVISYVESVLPEFTEKANITIPEHIAAANVATEQAASEVAVGRSLIDEFGGLNESLSSLHLSFVEQSAVVIGNLEELRKKIDQARTLANGIHLPAKFERETHLRLRTPENLEGGVSSNLRMFFKTPEENGLLFYAGPSNTAAAMTSDYLALEVVEGSPVFKFNNGMEDIEVPVETNVADGQWHEAIAQRNGRFGTLTIFSDGPRVKTNQNSGSTDESSLDFDRNDTVIFVGAADSSLNLPETVSGSPLVGAVDEIYFDEQPLGLWNFAAYSFMNSSVIRNISVLSEEVNTEDEGAVYFNGNGYVKLQSTNLGSSLVVQLSFKTSSPHGLIFFTGGESDFVALELVDGICKMTVSAGGILTSLQTRETYANQKWTSVSITRRGATTSLSVEQKERLENPSVSGYAPPLDIESSVYIGGLVGIDNNKFKSIARHGFLGCIKDLVILRSSIEIYPGIESSGVFPKCIPQSSNLVSFPAPIGGFVSLPGTDFNTNRDLLFRFRTAQDNGLMLYMSDGAHEHLLAMSLKNGAVEAMFVRSRTNTVSLVSKERNYNDSMWHSVNIKRAEGKVVKMIIDDVDLTSEKVRVAGTLDQTFFVGGLPFDLPFNDDVIPDPKPFIGCISDITMGYDYKNIADRLTDENPSFSYCPERPQVIDVTSGETTMSPLRTPSPLQQCALGPIPIEIMDPQDTGAKFYGLSAESRTEFSTIGSADSVISFEIKTAADYGTIFYTADSSQIDFIAMYLRDGHLVLGFCYGQEIFNIESSIVINDLEWHQVEAIRDGFDGFIFVDGKEVASGTLVSTFRILKVETALYVGGLPNSSELTVNDIIKESRTSLVGCIKNFLVDEEEKELIQDVDVENCQGLREPGMYFEGGYVIQDPSFRVGRDKSIRFEMKPRSANGTIFSVQKSEGDFMSLEMRNGELYLTVENGGGEFVAHFVPENGTFAFCDGMWHSVQVDKTRYLAVLSVDGVIVSGKGSEGALMADTDDPLYFGAIPDTEEHDGIHFNEPFIGCIKNLYIEDQRINLEEGIINEPVTPRYCPFA